MNDVPGLKSLRAANTTPMEDYQVLYNELKLYRDGLLLEKPSLIALNKLDMSDEKYV